MRIQGLDVSARKQPSLHFESQSMVTRKHCLLMTLYPELLDRVESDSNEQAFSKAYSFSMTPFPA